MAACDLGNILLAFEGTRLRRGRNSRRQGYESPGPHSCDARVVYWVQYYELVCRDSSVGIATH